jgi:hypothetical protein
MEEENRDCTMRESACIVYGAEGREARRQGEKVVHVRTLGAWGISWVSSDDDVNRRRSIYGGEKKR